MAARIQNQLHHGQEEIDPGLEDAQIQKTAPP
jgi:hypothetical protein